MGWVPVGAREVLADAVGITLHWEMWVTQGRLRGLTALWLAGRRRGWWAEGSGTWWCESRPVGCI